MEDTFKPKTIESSKCVLCGYPTEHDYNNLLEKYFCFTEDGPVCENCFDDTYSALNDYDLRYTEAEDYPF